MCIVPIVICQEKKNMSIFCLSQHGKNLAILCAAGISLVKSFSSAFRHRFRSAPFMLNRVTNASSSKTSQDITIFSTHFLLSDFSSFTSSLSIFFIPSLSNARSAYYQSVLLQSSPDTASAESPFHQLQEIPSTASPCLNRLLTPEPQPLRTCFPATNIPSPQPCRPAPTGSHLQNQNPHAPASQRFCDPVIILTFFDLKIITNPAIPYSFPDD